jgi:hypothetical protein
MSKFKRFTVFVFLFQGVIFSKVYSQDPTNTIGRVSISAPTAASLGKYGDIPVSYHTGIPNIDIPVYTIKSGSLSVPVSLSYHASGLKVQEQAGWAGAGWSLNAGGVITRTVKGSADDRGYTAYQGYINACTKGHYSDFGYNNYLVSGTNTSLYDGQIAQADQNLTAGYSDGEPDMFFLNFAGYSGKFYFNDDRTPVLVPEQDLNIQVDYQLGPGFNGFIITTSDGTRYHFGRTGNYSSAADPVESTIPSTINSGPSFMSAAASSWYLNKVMSSDGMDSITFQYQAESYSYYTWSMFPVTNDAYSGSPTPLSRTNGVDLVKNMVNGVRLSKIIFPNGTVTFNRSAAARTDLSNGTWGNMTDVVNTNSYSLGSIQIADNTGFCKKDSLFYGYFSDNTTDFHSTFWGTSLDGYSINSDKTLLRLDSIRESSCDQTLIIPPYKFSYFTEFVPRRLSFGIDHWGFYNGVNNNVGLIPTYTLKDISGVISQKYGANRDAAWPAMRGGTMQKITYPTGGSTVLDFEPNNTNVNYNNYVSTFATSVTAGYTVGSPITQNINLSGDTYQLIVSNSAGLASATANVEIYNAGQSVVYNSGTIPQGETDTFYFALPAAAGYSIHVWKEGYTSSTGAVATFNDQVPHTVNGNVIVGGLRIKTITNNDGTTLQNTVTNYTYNYANNPAGNSSGILYSRPNYVQWIRNGVFETVYGLHPLCDFPTLYKSPASIRPMQNTQGNHIGYNEVYVSQVNNGYSVYKYYGSNAWDFNISDVCIRYIDGTTACGNTVPNLPAAPVSFEYMRGELKYDAQVNQNGKTLKESWHFPTYAPDPMFTPGHISASLPNGMFSYTEYNLQSAYKIKDSVSVTVSDQQTNGYLTTINTVNYNSAYHHQPTSKVTNSSTGDIFKTNLLYASDFRISNFNVPDSLNYYLNAVHNDSVTLFNAFNACPANELTQPLPVSSSCHKTAFVQFRAATAIERMNFVAYRRRTYTDPGNLYITAHNTSKANAGTELKPIFEMQDAYQNPVIEQSEWKNANFLHANFTRYDYVTAPAGKIYLNKTQLINLAAPSGTFTNAAVSTNAIIKDSRYTDEASYFFGNGNPLHVIPKDGVANSYVWDYLNTQPVAKISNATSDQVAYTSFEADGKGNWTFTGAPVTDITSPTGGKCYGLPSGSISKPGLTSAASYVVSYWSKTGTSYTVTGSTAVKQGKTINGWTFFEHTVTGTTTVTVSGTGSIDELRLYPQTAQMTTYTYTPLLGMSSQCDADNRISYYQYDLLGRLAVVKDQDGNIIKTVQYNYKNQVGN